MTGKDVYTLSEMSDHSSLKFDYVMRGRLREKVKDFQFLAHKYYEFEE